MSRYQRFLDLHRSEDLFLMPNPPDAGTARILASLGFAALATTSSGHAATLGRHDQTVTRSELLEHVAALADSVDIPINADSERLFADAPEEIAEPIELLIQAGASGCSIEDYDPKAAAIDPLDKSVERVEAAVAACKDRLVLTARAENHLYGNDDLADTVRRLCAFRDAGADCVYAPGLTTLADIATIVEEVAIPVNVLIMPTGPTVAELEQVGVRRVSTGGLLTWAAYGALADAARELLDHGTADFTASGLSVTDRRRAFGA
jgi:2-methylisocitrate lyase-like PEP mutase family enzyme